jgi:hypothetical protein
LPNFQEFAKRRFFFFGCNFASVCQGKKKKRLEGPKQYPCPENSQFNYFSQTQQSPEACRGDFISILSSMCGLAIIIHKRMSQIWLKV